MQYDTETLRRIFDRTAGRCHICGGGLCFSNYGEPGSRGAWEREHSVAHANGGSDHLNNQYPAHISCNRKKGTKSTRSARAACGRTRAPMSQKARETAKNTSAAVGATIGGLVGLLAGPGGAVVGAVAGGLLGHGLDPET
jgi:5-methylcytosine-specific restriction endonuclease McrA